MIAPPRSDLGVGEAAEQHDRALDRGLILVVEAAEDGAVGERDLPDSPGPLVVVPAAP
jgi:hypothetical protein